jgi:hypothetical protein
MVGVLGRKRWYAGINGAQEQEASCITPVELLPCTVEETENGG